VSDSHIRLVLVEDSPDDALLLERALRDLDAELTRVDSLEGLRAALDTGPDLVLSDYRLRGFDAGDALALTREVSAEIPFIVVSGTIGEELAVDLLRAGADDFVTKGTWSRLIPAIQRELRKRSLRAERARLEAALDEQERRLRAIVSQLPAAVWAVDLEAKLTFAAGRAAVAMQPEPRGRPLVEVIAASPDRVVIQEAHARALAGEQASYVSQHGGRVFESSLRPLYDRDGSQSGAIGVALDVTERVAAERALERETASLRLQQRTAIAANAASTVRDALDQVLDLATEHARCLGAHAYVATPDSSKLTSSGVWSRAARIPPAFREVSEAHDFEPGEGLVGAVWSTGDVLVEPAPADESRFLRAPAARDGGIECVVAAPVWLGDEVVAVLELFDDRPVDDPRLLDDLDSIGSQIGRVFERDRSVLMERQLQQTQKMEAIGRLAGGIAHDFNNLLTVIGCMVTMSREHPDLPEDLQEDLGAAEDAVRSATDLTRRLLLFSRGQTIERRVVQPDELVEGAVGMLTRIIGEDVRIEVECDPTTPPVIADVQQIEQILMNLAVNARDAMPGGGQLSIHVQPVNVEPGSRLAREGLPPGPHAQIVVSDTGEGIPEDVLPRVFEPFFTTKDAARGTGLGLSTVHGIVQQCGGRIDVESQPGDGARFTIVLPATTETDREPSVESAPMRSSRAGRTILVVDDDAMMRQAVRRTLDAAGYEVLLASAADEALSILGGPSGASIDLVLSDVVMPRGSGGELARALLASRPGLPVLLMSGYPQHELTDERSPPPGIKLLTKPFEPRHLVHVIEGEISAA